MSSKTFFEESQRPKQLWIWAIMIGANLLPLMGLYSQAILKKPFGNNPASNTELIVIFFCLLFLSFFIFGMTLKTKIKEDGIYVKVFPFHRRYKFYKWDKVSDLYVRKYKPLSEFGGWGIRYAFNKGKAYNVSGNMGLQIEFKNGKKLLIGTNKPQELEIVINIIKLSISNDNIAD